LKNF
jgi:hypothetical protein